MIHTQPPRSLLFLAWLGADVLWLLLCWIVVPDHLRIPALLVGLVSLHTISVVHSRQMIAQLAEHVSHEAHLRGIIANSAHNIKHPVATALRILVDLKQTAAMTDHQRVVLLESLQPKLECNLTLLDTRMRELLELARTGLVPHAAEAITTHTLATRIEAMMTREHRGSRPPLQARVWVDGTDTTVETIPLLVEGVIENFVKNAHAAQQALDVAIVDVRIVPTEHDLRIHVTDHGPGFPQALLRQRDHHIYYDKSHSFGSGLGLLGVQFVLRQLHGHMELSNHPERGAQVTLVLPRSIKRGHGCRFL